MVQICTHHSLQKYHGICKVMEKFGSKGMKTASLLTVSQSSATITSTSLNAAKKVLLYALSRLSEMQLRCTGGIMCDAGGRTLGEV